MFASWSGAVDRLIFLGTDYHGTDGAPTIGANERRSQMSRTSAIFIFLAGLNGLMAVLAGAWASHGSGVFPLVSGGDALAESGSRFQMFHALALLGIALAHEAVPAPYSFFSRILGTKTLLRLAGIAFIIGIAGFSGGLYASAAGTSTAGLAPLGGTALMVGWLLMGLAGLVSLFAR